MLLPVKGGRTTPFQVDLQAALPDSGRYASLAFGWSYEKYTREDSNLQPPVPKARIRQELATSAHAVTT